MGQVSQSDNRIQFHRATLPLLLTVLATVIIQGAVVVWKVSAMNAAIGHTQEDLQQLRAQLSTQTAKRYDSDMAAADKVASNKLFEMISKRIDLAERRIERLEDKQ